MTSLAALEIPGEYRIEKRLHATDHAVVYAAVREADGVPVVLKAYAPDASGKNSRARREFEILRALDGSGVVRALDYLDRGRLPLLVLERVSGISLWDWAKASRPRSEAFLAVAIQLAQTLMRVHDARILHCDLHPGNAVVNPTTLDTRLIDFGVARPLLRGAGRREQSSGQSSGAIGGFAGALHFIAPEQTGRMDRGIDTRSDLYTLGATFYFALTGTTPFENKDRLGLIHAHIARLPQAPIARRPELSPTLSRIVVKLLQKEPEDRYQSARALHRDLEECLQQLHRTGRIDDDFPLATSDAPVRPLFSKRLYGRESELARLHAAYERARQGTAQWVLLGGAPGTGKSALVNELRRPVANTGGYLATGKFDLYRRDVPYSGWIAAFDSLIQQLLTEPEQSLARWREQLRGALGNIAAALVELIPYLGFVLGEVPPVPVLGGSETQARLMFAVQRFVQGCARPEHPLVLFLDDLQWSDAGSRDLLQVLQQTPNVSLLVIGAYRDSEVDASHPLSSLFARIEAAGLSCERIPLLELTPAAAQQMLADALGRTQSEAEPLSRVVLRRTGSNPLLIQQFILHMHALGLITFAYPGSWVWSEHEIESASIPEGTVAMLTAKLQRLAPQARELIEFASCVGDEFDIELLMKLSGHGEQELAGGVFALLDEGLLSPSLRGFRFVHDRIREAAQGLIPPPRRVELHRDMARLLQADTRPELLAERAFELADHWNHARAGVLEEEERQQALSVNLQAGSRARRSGAATTASTYFASALSLLRQDDWERAPATAFELLAEAAEAAYQMREFARALELLDQLQARPLDRAQQILVDKRRIAVLTFTQPDAALELTLGALRRLGLRWPPRPSPLRALASMLYTASQIGNAVDERAFPRQSTWNETDRLQRQILTAGGAAMLNSSVFLIVLVTNARLRLCHRKGVSDDLAFVLSAFSSGWLMAGGSWARFQRYVAAAQYWIGQIPGPLSARGSFSLEIFALPLMQPRRPLADALAKTTETLRELGDVEYASYGARYHLHLLALCGEPLRVLARTAQPLPQVDQDLVQAYALLQESELGAIDWTAALEEAQRRLQEVPTLHGTCVRVHWAIALCLAGELERAWLWMESFVRDVNSATTSGGSLAEFALYRGLCAAALAASAPRRAHRQHWRHVKRNLRALRTLAARSSDFEPQLRLLEAEHAVLRGAVPQALRLYSQSAQLARSLGLRHQSALAHERRAALLQRQGRMTEALASMRAARDLYAEWGAVAKTAQLERAIESLRPA